MGGQLRTLNDANFPSNFLNFQLESLNGKEEKRGHVVHVLLELDGGEKSNNT
jgi:hypothetical protein